MAFVYKVKKGDTLSKLGIPEEILKANPGLSKLSAGQVINIPSSGIPKGFQIGASGQLTSGAKTITGAGYSRGGGGITYPSGTGIPGPGLGGGGQPPVGNNGTGLGSGGGWSAGGGGIDYGPGGTNRGNDYGTNPAKFGNQPGGGGMMPGQQSDPKVPQFIYSGGVIRRNTQSAISPGGGGINYSTRNGTPINPLTGVAGPGLGAGGANPGQGKPGNTTLPPNYEPGGGGINYGSGYGNQQRGTGLDANGNKLQPNGLSSSTEEWIDFENPPAQMTWEEYNARLMAARAAGYTGPAIREVNGQIVKGYWNPAAAGGYQQPAQQQTQQTQQAPNTFVGGNNNTNSQMNWRF